MDIVPVILSGGSGKRLWPLSHEQRPKQFLSLNDKQDSLYQGTLKRALGITDGDAGKIVTITLADFEDETFRQAGSIDPALTSHVIIEPEQRNTAAAILYSAFYIADKFSPDSMMLVLPSDHIIQDDAQLKQSIDRARESAGLGKIVTFGIQPDYASTEYGYIQRGKSIDNHSFDVEKFVEKPDLKRAQEYIQHGEFLWNSGIFLMTAQTVINEFKCHVPHMFETIETTFDPTDLNRIPELAYESLAAIPFDKAILEKSESIAVIPCDMQWADIGSWATLWDKSTKDKSNNAIQGNVTCEDSHGLYVHNTSDKKIICIGLEDLVIADMGDVLMIRKK